MAVLMARSRMKAVAGWPIRRCRKRHRQPIRHRWPRASLVDRGRAPQHSATRQQQPR